MQVTGQFVSVTHTPRDRSIRFLSQIEVSSVCVPVLSTAVTLIYPADGYKSFTKHGPTNGAQQQQHL